MEFLSDLEVQWEVRRREDQSSRYSAAHKESALSADSNVEVGRIRGFTETLGHLSEIESA
jgi:hypothetical protein